MLGGRESLDTAVNLNCKNLHTVVVTVMKIRKERMRDVQKI